MGILKEQLQVYYNTYFPTDKLCDWLSNTSDVSQKKTLLSRREFSFTLPGDIYLRYQSFPTSDDFKKALVQKAPEKIDIGAVYNVPPVDHSSVALGSFLAKEKEMVFDIDMNDYNNVRMCECKDAQVCHECWDLMNCAQLVLHSLLTEEFGFEHLLFVFSGRRGIHCWVCDPRVRLMNQEVRSAIVSFIQIYQGSNENNAERSQLNLFTKTPHISFSQESEVFSICEHYFVELFVEKWNILGHKDKILNIFINTKDSEIKKEVEEFLEKHTKVSHKESTWTALKDLLKKKKKPHFVVDIVYTFVYPRLDANVSKHLNHLLKSPFCVHPKTGTVSIPIDLPQISNDEEEETPNKFYPPEDSPNIHKLIDEDKEHVTRLKSAVTRFGNFIRKLNKETKQKQSDDMKF